MLNIYVMCHMNRIQEFHGERGSTNWFNQYAIQRDQNKDTIIYQYD